MLRPYVVIFVFIFSYLWSYIPFYLYDEMVSAILNGVNQTVEEMKKNWKLGEKFNLKTYAFKLLSKILTCFQWT